METLSRMDSVDHGPFLRRTALDAAIGALLLAFLLSIVANSASMDRTEFGEAVRTTLVFAVDYFAFFFAAVSVMPAFVIV